MRYRHTYTYIYISTTYKPVEGHVNKDEANVGKETCVKSQKLNVFNKTVMLIWSNLAKQNVNCLESEHIS